MVTHWVAGALCAVVSMSGVFAAEIIVDAGRLLGPVNRMVFGHNLEAGDTKGIFGPETRVGEISTGAGFWDPVNRRPVPHVLRYMDELKVPLMRYPGGSLTGNFDWRKTVGPLAERGDWKFGLDEYLKLCRAMKAEPIITVSDYVLPVDEMPQHAADLVEYLNAPATEAHPWALKRKEWGHPNPYGVKFFELGNESNFGNHDIKPFRRFTADGYADYAVKTAAAMRRIDPEIRIGVGLGGLGQGQDVYSHWNKTILRKAGASADFIIIHLYSPRLSKLTPFFKSEERMMAACMAVGDQLEFRIQQYNDLVLAETGRRLPLAVTEFNALLIAREPKPYRFSYGAALQSADLLRVFLKPENNILAANYWQLLNGFFGMLRTDPMRPDLDKVEEMPAFPLFRLWAQHFGTELIEVTVTSPTAPFEGWPGVSPSIGLARVSPTVIEQLRFDPVLAPSGLSEAGRKSVTISRDANDGLVFIFDQFSGSEYVSLGTIGKPPGIGEQGCDYRVSFEGRFVPSGEGESVPVSLQLSDSRGWENTFSAIEAGPIGEGDWQSFSEDLCTVPKCVGVSLIGRLIAKSGSISGRLEIRNPTVSAITKLTFPEYSLLTASASISADRKKVSLIVFNKSDSENLATDIVLKGFVAGEARVWVVDGPGLTAVSDVKEVRSGEPLTLQPERLSFSFPAHSMTAIEITGAFSAGDGTTSALGAR